MIPVSIIVSMAVSASSPPPSDFFFFFFFSDTGVPKTGQDLGLFTPNESHITFYKTVVPSTNVQYQRVSLL